VMLLAAIVAAISLTHRPSVNMRRQNIAKQIAVEPKDRMRIVKMPSEKKT